MSATATESVKGAAPCQLDWRTASRWACEHVARAALTAPVAEERLRRVVAAFVAEHAELADAPSVAAVLLNNAVWLPRVRAVPPARRLLLLPQCLRDARTCPAEHDAAGLVCEQCGRCEIGALVAEAESLGYVTLVAEGATLVRQLLAVGRVDAVVGVGCLDSLEKLFPDMVSHAVPGLAVPLRRAGCVCTDVDAEWVRTLLRLDFVDTPRPADDVAATVREWFERSDLVTLLGGEPRTEVERLALEAIVRGGRRWRPYLCVAAYEALDGGQPVAANRALRELALAVECFHKASLVHDDFEDGDAERYGLPTLHVLHGANAAVNAGDFLVGEGYRLLGEAVRGLEGRRAAEMLGVAAAGHRMLCVGQGEELRMVRDGGRFGVDATLAMLTDKTAPAFDVALRLGALMAGGGADVGRALERFSRAFGTAFQLQDDIDDFESGADLRQWRPNIVVAFLCESAHPAARRAVDDTLTRVRDGGTPDVAALLLAARESGAFAQADALRATWRARVSSELDALPAPRLADWLRRIVVQALRTAVAT